MKGLVLSAKWEPREGYELPETGLDGHISVVMGYAAMKSYEEDHPVKLSEIEGDQT